MFGLLSPCRHTLDDDLLEQWRAHMCGLCVSLRDQHGQASRLTTNTDAIMVSVLTAAQSSAPTATTDVGRCPLRGMRPATVIAAADPGIRLATTTSLTLAAAKAADVVDEQRLSLAPRSRVRSVAASVAGKRLRGHAGADRAIAGELGVEDLLHELSGQAPLEAHTGTDLASLTHASGIAASRVFAATAAVAGADSNRDALADIGYDFGRLAHLLDAVDDYESDARDGSFNPLRATGTDIGTALDDCRRLARAIRRRYRSLDLADDRLLRAVLVDGVRQAVSSRTHRFGGCASGSCSTTHAAPTALTSEEWPAHLPTTRPPEQSPGGPNQPPFPPNREFYERILPFIGVSCTGYACCADHWNHCSDEWQPAWCSGCDCCSCRNCDCDDCCDCGDCCDCCGDDCCCDCDC
ncbi:MAG: regulator [Gordonia sp.]|uniref:DUF5685 family protein n=1 Tax=Gordonia sp. (in: high G+C Gram-positive bacteria) TaxID=84139 RepID=UPI001D3B98CA|nr:DUF5685 family protein [Gordonia sp. (in: high G+C Gram-positive bacteria)]MCB1295159.1 regulator [Gordonia sp. (in: high G+C Gram-positive bacteria)]